LILEEGEYMNVTERINLVRIIDKMNEHKEFSKKLRLRDTSVFKEYNKDKKQVMI
jgi:hypothetical protein